MGCHGNKLTGNLHIQPLHLVQVGKILLQNSGNGYILNFDFVFAQQQKNGVKRAFKILHFLAAGMDDPLKTILGF